MKIRETFLSKNANCNPHLRKRSAKKLHIWTFLAIPIAWYKAQIPGFPRKSIRERASRLFGRGPQRPQNIFCSRATQTCTGGVALEQETILGLSGPHPKRLLAPSLIDFRGNPGIRALCQAIGVPTLSQEFAAFTIRTSWITLHHLFL